MRRVGLVALLFVLASLSRMHWNETAHFEFLTGLLDVAPGGGASAKYAPAENADLVIFYNLYIPHDEAGIKNAIEVIEDQMGQIAGVLQRIEGEGGAGKMKEEKQGVVFYNLIGNENAFLSDRMGELCHRLHPRLECTQLQFYEEAGEAVTLQDVHDFCKSDLVADANRTRVVYLHSKGSYHSQKENHIWRRQMTDASLHPDCLNPPDDTCDVCGAQFYIKYAIMFPGNMWTAKCSYVNKLIPPNDGEYARRKTDSVKQFLMLRLWGVLQATLDKDNVEHYGLDRYQWEHWIAHPSIQPCEVHTTDVGPLILLGKDQKGRKFGPEYYDFGMAPRRIAHNLGGLREPRLRLERQPELQFREYYYLPGNLLKWFSIYGAEGIPAPDSWVWRDFPAGERWKELVAQHGENAVDEMVKSSNPPFHSAFASTQQGTVFGEESLPRDDPPVVVFYHVSIPPGNAETALAVVKSQFEVIFMGRYDNATMSFDQSQKTLLYYTIAGGGTEETNAVANLCKEKGFECRQLGAYDTNEVEGETLQRLHEFCKARPSFDVVYLSNVLPGYKIVEKALNAPVVRAITSTVLSKMCRPTAGRCNVCGTEFYPLPFLHLTGNMFSASCDYANKLQPPSTFETSMNDIARDALVAQIEEVYTTRLRRFTPQILGSYQHSVEHWIGSHPDLTPCDVAPMSAGNFNAPIADQMSQYSLGMAPRRGSAPPGFFTDDGEPKLRKKREAALREYYYLAGNVFRWHRLYGKPPDASSWAWQWYPDGHAWEAAARISGANAVNVLAKRFLGEDGNDR
ncbi:hypothetical protein ACHAXT_003441 [Thalassiosira profunda]